jgi:hypothetical protein
MHAGVFQCRLLRLLLPWCYALLTLLLPADCHDQQLYQSKYKIDSATNPRTKHVPLLEGRDTTVEFILLISVVASVLQLYWDSFRYN